MLVWGAWRGLGGKAKLYSSLRMDHAHDFPALGSYSTCVDATNRDSGELRGLLALILEYNRQVQCGYPIVLPDSTAVAVCKVARAHQHRPFRAWARTSKTGSGWWSGFKLHVHCDTAGRLSAFDLTTATVDDRKLLGPLTRGIGDGMVAGDSGSRSQAKARELATRGISLIPTPRIGGRSPLNFSWPVYNSGTVEELCECLPWAFGLVRTTHRAPYALPIHLLVCLVAYSLYKRLST